MKYEKQMDEIEAFNRAHGLRPNNETAGFTIPLWIWCVVSVGTATIWCAGYLLVKLAIRSWVL